ncbi:MAG: TetR/AcrR family transcriptional regulator [Pseudoxanthomonas sp.]
MILHLRYSLMAKPGTTALKPRKQPRQARSQATVDAIFEATIQVLLAEGPQRLTTIRVAERAGVSVGTLYQYYPNKQALLFGVLQRHMQRVDEVIGRAIASVQHTPLATMVPAVIEVLVREKTSRIDESRALYAIVNQLEARELVRSAESRARTRLSALLETATDARFDDIGVVAYIFFAALNGPLRVALEGGASPKILHALRSQMESLCLGYLEREARPLAAKR